MTFGRFFFFSQYIRIDRVSKKLRRFFENLFFDRRVIFEYFLNDVFFFKSFFLNFELNFFDFISDLNLFDDLRFFLIKSVTRSAIFVL